MQRSAIQIERLYLKCDACDHHETVPQITQAEVGTPCPKCGADMLTQEDYDAFSAHVALLDAINMDVGPIDGDGPTSGVLVSVNHHAGEWNIKIKEATRDS